MLLDIVAVSASIFVLYKIFQESSKNQRIASLIGATISIIYCSTQWKYWPNNCVDPITRNIQPCGPWDGHPHIIITSAITLFIVWLSTKIVKLKT